MRRFVFVAILIAGCHAEDVAPPVLQRPIESLPPGARAVVLGSDLANTWQRIEAHDLRTVLESLPGIGPALRAPALERVMAACRAVEQATGTSLENDLVLNVLGGRTGVGIYGGGDMRRDPDSDAPATEPAPGDAQPAPTDLESTPTHTNSHPDVLLVAELRDPARFHAALTALAGQTIEGVRVELDTFDGDPAWRVSDAEGFVLQIVQRDAFVVATASPELARAARALHAAGGTNALHDPALAAALGTLGAHNVVALGRDSDTRWVAHAFTWDEAGLHFDHVASVDAATASNAGPEPRRDAILGSLPDGLTLAAYGHRDVLDLAHRRADAGAHAHVASHGVAGLWSMLPSDFEAWAGDEIGIALRGIEPTALAPIPDIAFVLEVADVAAAETALRALEARLAMLPIGPTARAFEDVSYGGRTFRSAAQPPGAERVSPSWMLDGDVAVIATTRALMQQIVDTRRSGRRSAKSDGSFKRFRDFVPPDAGAVVYADQRRLRRVAQELERSASLWGPKVEQGVLTLGRVSTLLEHFPAGAAYATVAGDQLAVHGWMLEDN